MIGETILQQFIWQCCVDKCCVEAIERYRHSVPAVMADCEFPRPSLPIGWTIVEGRTYCDRHLVAVSIAVTHTKPLRTLIAIDVDRVSGKKFARELLDRVLDAREWPAA